MSATEVVEADLTWTGTRFEPDVRIAIGADGRIAAVGRLPAEPTRRLAGRALLPGFVNAHSHAFQRALRGQAERFPAGGGSFWTWREAMYRLVDRLDEDALHRVCLQAFGEMLDAGITTVGEFHYLHHARDSKDFALDAVVLGAAASAGIRIVLLEAYYVTGGIGRPLEGAPLRFDSISPQAYWRQMDRLDAVRDPKTQSLGAVAHSIRAARPEDIGSLYAEASRRGLVFHLHMEEQPKEIEETLAAYGQRPLELLNETLGRAERVTAVHCTHSEAADLTRFLARGGRV
ncbi:MAG TPA: amidohydrolase family protein, partial [Gemmatimonadales bacterium]|nr:amidohydrolase family protein [Gemmatimonadales bacterium]